MAYVPYLTNEEFLAYSSGVDLSKFNAREITAILNASSRMADGFCQCSFQYSTINEEVQDWQNRDVGFGAGWEVYPYHLPVRTISKFFIAVGMNSGTGEYVGINVPVIPVRIIDPSVPPRTYGSIFVDNDRGFVQTTLGALNYTPFVQIFPNTMQPVSVILSYSGGYDNGQIQDDGYSVIFPDWLSEATRMIAVEVAAERILGAAGMTGLQSLRVGDIHMARMTGRLRGADPHSAIPADAKELLRPHRRIVLVG